MDGVQKLNTLVLLDHRKTGADSDGVEMAHLNCSFHQYYILYSYSVNVLRFKNMLESYQLQKVIKSSKLSLPKHSSRIALYYNSLLILSNRFWPGNSW